MKYPTVFHLISAVFKKAGIASVLIGGFAVNYYKVTRQTADVDFLITKTDFEKISSLLKKEGYEEDYIQKVFSRLKGNRLYLMDLDFMFIDEDTLEEIIKGGKEISIAGQKFMVPSLEHLIALKLHAIKHNFEVRKNKDIPDIVNLLINNKVKAKSGKFKDLCLKYGTEKIYKEILDRI